MPTRLAAAVPGGGLPSLPPAYPPSVYFPAPYSPTPLPRRSRGRTTHPAGVCLRNRQLAAKPIEQPFYWRCRQPRRGGTGGEELRRLRWSSPPGQIEQVPRGLAFFVACLPTLPSVYFPAPYPPDPLPRRGRGRPRLFHARGFAPCIPGAEPGRHRSRGRIARWRRGLPCLACSPRRCCLRRGACLLCRLPTLPLACFPAPYPPSPFPAGEGGDSKFISPGAPPPAPRG